VELFIQRLAVGLDAVYPLSQPMTVFELLIDFEFCFEIERPKYSLFYWPIWNTRLIATQHCFDIFESNAAVFGKSVLI
jgi:hypothetical protein